jgi:predicted AlkP superfamily pyrophosphatase or phosphodiesterase
MMHVARWLSLLAIVAGSTATARAAARDAHVVIVSIDGFPAYLLDDPKLPLPNIRRLAAAGAAAEGMKVSNPSVTWPNHTTLVTGVRPERHGVLFNGVLVRGGPGTPVFVDPKREQSDLIQAPTLFDAAHDAGLSTAAINWPCTRGATGLDDNFPDVPDAGRYATPRLREQWVAAGMLRSNEEPKFTADSPTGHDDAWTTMACDLVGRRKPNLLLLHLLNVDHTHHGHGPRTSPGYTALAYADACVGRLLAAIDQAGIAQQTTVFIVSDHGFNSTPRALRPNGILRQAGLLKSSREGKIDEAEVQVIPEGGIGMLYFTLPDPSPADLEKVRKLFLGLEGIAGILEPDEYAEFGFPQPRANRQMADLVLIARDGYAFAAAAEEPFVVPNKVVGNHGFLATDPKMNAVLVISGRGVKPGAKLPVVENIDVAPTAAELLGVEFPSAQGRVLSEVLTPAK